MADDLVPPNKIPLPMSIELDDRVESSKIPLAMTRLLGSPIDTDEPSDVDIIITAVAALNPVASASAAYDSNVFRGFILDKSSDFQSAKLQAVDNSSKFESNDNLNASITADWQQSKLISSDRQAAFDSNIKLTRSKKSESEQAKLVGTNDSVYFEAQKSLRQTKQAKTETAKLIGENDWFSFESMAKRQIERLIKGENSKLVTDKASTYSEYNKLIGLQKSVLTETARLPYYKLSYTPPPIWQTVILKEQIIEGWECGSGALRHYVYNDELALPMHRRIADRGPSSSLSMPLTIPRGVLILSADDANALPNYPCKRKTLAVNPTLDVTLCEPKVYGKAARLSFDTQTTFDPVAFLELIADGQGSAYNSGVIFVTNSVSLVRSDDGREIKLLGFTVGIDTDSYAWSFSATVPLSELSKVDIANEVQIGVDFTCNGNLWRFILDGCDDSIQFNESSLTIKGKSRAMLLAEPYADTRSFIYDTVMTSRQIADDELNRSGVPSGFTLDWQLAGVNGWNVPANSYSYTDKTPINSLKAIAESAGGFINAHMSNDIIHVLPTYPVPSWEWAAAEPLITLPQSLITSRSRGRVNKPDYNGVYMYCSNDNGISALIKRTGTAGGYQPSMITSDLMTDQDAAISRGKAVLSDTGDIGNIAISMPLHSGIGVLKPSTLIGVDDGEQWHGMVKGTTITGSLSSNRALVIEQNIDVERHFDKETV